MKLGDEHKGDKSRVSRTSKGNYIANGKKVDSKNCKRQNDSYLKTIEAQLASIVVALKSNDVPKVEKMDNTPSY